MPFSIEQLPGMVSIIELALTLLLEARASCV